jgi:predicted branched-subunit amino acid permease
MPTAGPPPPSWASERTAIVKDSLGVGIATGAYGASFGAVSVAAGLSVAQTGVLSLLMFTGASQFAMVGVAAAGGPPLSGAVTAVLLGTRNTLYGLRLAPLLAWAGWRRVGAAQLIVDESTAMAVTRSHPAAARVGFLTTGLSIFVLWNAFTLVGAVAGNAIGDPRSFGLDAAVGAAFLGLLWPRLRDRRNRLVAALGAAVALGLVPVAAAGVPVLASGGVALLVGLLSHGTDPTEIPVPDELPGGGRP